MTLFLGSDIELAEGFASFTAELIPLTLPILPYKEGLDMTNKRKHAIEPDKQSGQPKPMSGSHKVKNQNHSRQKNHSHHDM